MNPHKYKQNEIGEITELYYIQRNIIPTVLHVFLQLCYESQMLESRQYKNDSV